MEDIKHILTNIPDKREDTNTTSLKFKQDLIEFFGKDYKEKVCLEIGTNKGYTTRILSFLFKKVISCELDPMVLDMARQVNQDRDNIEFLEKDVYGTPWEFSDISIVFIDCRHEYEYVMMDIQNATRLAKPNQEIILVFDDYGMWKPPSRLKDVKDAVDQWINEVPGFDFIRFIGEGKGSDCRPGVLLKDEEGVICRYRSVQSLQ